MILLNKILQLKKVEYWYYDGLSIVALIGFRGDKPNELEFRVIQYISIKQSDCKTSRGIAVGDSVLKLKEKYPEVKEHEEYWTDNSADSGNAIHDNCFVYAPKSTNRSIIFLTKDDDIVVQIDIADGLDGQLWAPANSHLSLDNTD